MSIKFKLIQYGNKVELLFLCNKSLNIGAYNMTKDKKMVWIGPLPSKNKTSEIIRKGYRQLAATLSQQYFIDGIEKYLGRSIDIISAIRPPAYPEYTDLIIKKNTSSHSETSKDTNVGFINIKYLNHFFRQSALIKAAREWTKENSESNVDIIVYGMCSPFMKAAIEIKKIIPTAKITLIVPDLPLNMDMSSSLQRFLKRIDWINIKRFMRSVDNYVLFTKQMAQYLGLMEDKWIVIEGLIDEKKAYEDKTVVKYPSRVCVYAGTLKKIYKIDEFTKAFISANIKDTELHIYGNGDFRSELVDICNKHSNVKYMGVIPSNEVFERMKKATILVNPRPTKDEYTKYSCPSKTFEYLASGTPLLTTKLAGIPDEYFEHVFSFEDESRVGMKNKLIEIFALSDDELDSKGKAAQNFIRIQKNNEVQAKKVIDFIEKDM